MTGPKTLTGRQAIYSSRRWREEVRPAKLMRDPLCQALLTVTGPDGWPTTAPCGALAKHVDHWVPISKGGAEWDASNHVSLCHRCHSRKTIAEQHGKPCPFEHVPSAPLPMLVV